MTMGLIRSDWKFQGAYILNHEFSIQDGSHICLSTILSDLKCRLVLFVTIVVVDKLFNRLCGN